MFYIQVDSWTRSFVAILLILVAVLGSMFTGAFFTLKCYDESYDMVQLTK